MHGLNASDKNACTRSGFESQHGPDDPFDRPVVLLNQVVQVFDLAQLYGLGCGGFYRQDGCLVGGAAINTPLLRQSMQAHGLFSELASGSCIPLAAHQEVNGLVL